MSCLEPNVCINYEDMQENISSECRRWADSLFRHAQRIIITRMEMLSSGWLMRNGLCLQLHGTYLSISIFQLWFVSNFSIFRYYNSIIPFTRMLRRNLCIGLDKTSVFRTVNTWFLYLHRQAQEFSHFVRESCTRSRGWPFWAGQRQDIDYLMSTMSEKLLSWAEVNDEVDELLPRRGWKPGWGLASYNTVIFIKIWQNDNTKWNGIGCTDHPEWSQASTDSQRWWVGGICIGVYGDDALDFQAQSLSFSVLCF